MHHTTGKNLVMLSPPVSSERTIIGCKQKRKIMKVLSGDIGMIAMNSDDAHRDHHRVSLQSLYNTVTQERKLFRSTFCDEAKKERIMQLTEDILFKIEEQGEEIISVEYGYLDESDAFSHEDIRPEQVKMVLYEGTYYVWVDGLMEETSKRFTSETEAKDYLLSLEGKGVKSEEKQIGKCINKTIDPDRIEIRQHVNCIRFGFDIFYKGCLIAEHLRSLDPEKIDRFILKFQNASKEKQIREIKKKSEWNSNQKYYLVTYENGETEQIHIPSVYQGQERCVFEVLSRKQNK